MRFNQLALRLRQFKNQKFGVGVGESEIKRVELKLGINITGSYRDFLHQFGWGEVEHIEIFGLGHNIPNHLHIENITISERKEMFPRLKKNLLPFNNDGAGNLYCLDCDYIQNGENPIVFWDHEASSALDKVADNFCEWLLQELNEYFPSRLPGN